ncbi:deoxyribose-phosphate aldolase [Tessaracoccus sp. ZS01]|uniref:deoxyribose-phosphate aldolase n=1 Tax=Tessaracoccus sp. ZS01 TaxID=1906324 RepID=UPI00096E9A05|nr:deoxyribose-phosphate aldolase [Tessaracoccus sp. ZS01]MCG6568265.1 deoxyribose-phosphate aldolase [Tessaracoccus sp. ZS01]OMG53356.1 deoxyribose-phosphate aldolase [Tessaracoccus sp. ZS01]
MQITRSALAQMIDHTLLKTDATRAQVAALVAEARELGTYSVCVSPSMLPIDVELGDVLVATVCGFPSGNHTPAAKAAEAAESARLGAHEVDMVINIGLLKEGRADLVEAEIRAVREAAPDVLLKVIIESAALTDDEIVAACRAAEAAGADYVKTSTGFHPSGGASVHAVSLMAQTVGDRLGVKASGGIRDYATANAMAEAGATRLGLSGSASVLAGAEGVESGEAPEADVDSDDDY